MCISIISTYGFILNNCACLHIAVIKEEFMKHLGDFKPFLIQGLQRVDEYQVCMYTSTFC